MEQLASSCQLLFDVGCVIGGEEAEPTGYLELGVEFGPRADCDTHMIQVTPTGAARMPLGDVRRDRQSRPTQLRLEHKAFRGGQPGDLGIRGHDQVHCSIPDEQVPKGLNRCHDVSFSATRILFENAVSRSGRVQVADE
jgi:hypothetical protein